MKQAYTIAPQEPYRIRVLRAWICPERGLVILNCNIRNDYLLDCKSMSIPTNR